MVDISDVDIDIDVDIVHKLLTTGTVGAPVKILLSGDSNACMGDRKLILDTGGEENIFRSRSLFTELWRSSTPIIVDGVRRGAKPLIIDREGLTPFGPAYYERRCQANIISFGRCKDRFNSVRYIEEDDTFYIKVADQGDVYIFRRDADSECNLYVCDLDKDILSVEVGLNITNDSDDSCGVITENGSNRAHVFASKTIRKVGDFPNFDTVKHRSQKYNKRQQKRAARARKLVIDSTFSSRTVIDMLNAGKIDNSDLTARDVHIALDIWGPDLQGLKGRTTDKKPAPIITQPIHVPQSVDQFIYVDIMFVNGIPYLVSVSDPMEYSLVTKLANKNQWTILKALRRHISEYTKFDYKVHKVYVDGESAINSSWFKQKCEVPIDVSSESVGKIERKIRVIKERLRGIINVLPFNLTQRMEGWLVYYAVSRINLQPTANSGSNLSPREKLYHRRIDYKKDLKHGVFDYVQVHMDNTDSPTYNGMQSRTQGAIALMPVGNEEGSWYYMLLSDFSVIKRNRATPLPMPDEVISYLNTHSSARKGSFSRVPQLIQGSSFSIIEDEPSEDEEEDHDFGGDLPPQYFVHEINDDVEEPNGADLLVGEFADEDEEIDRDLLEPFVFPPQPVNQPINNEELLRDIFGGDSDDENEQAHEEEDNASADGTAKNASEQASEENKKNPYGLRPRTGKKWSKYGLAALLKWRTKQRFLNRRFGLNMTVKQGIDKLGDKAIASIIKEMSQLVRQ